MSQHKQELRRNLFKAINNALNEINASRAARQYRANASTEMLRRVQSASPLEISPQLNRQEAQTLVELLNSTGYIPKVNIAKNTPPKPKRSKSTSNLPRNNR